MLNLSVPGNPAHLEYIRSPFSQLLIGATDCHSMVEYPTSSRG